MLAFFFVRNSIDNGSLMRNPCFSNVCVCANAIAAGWMEDCVSFFPIHVHPSVRSPILLWGSCPLRNAHEGHRTAQQHKSRRTIMNYLWSDITQAGRLDDGFLRCRCVGVCPTNSCFPEILAVSSTWVFILNAGYGPSQSVRGRFAISRIDTVMFSVRPRCPLSPSRSAG